MRRSPGIPRNKIIYTAFRAVWQRRGRQRDKREAEGKIEGAALARYNHGSQSGSALLLLSVREKWFPQTNFWEKRGGRLGALASRRCLVIIIVLRCTPLASANYDELVMASSEFHRATYIHIRACVLACVCTYIVPFSIERGFPKFGDRFTENIRTFLLTSPSLEDISETRDPTTVVQIRPNPSGGVYLSAPRRREYTNHFTGL